MTTKITEQNISNLANIGVQWQSVFTGDGSTGLTAVAGRGYFINTTSGTVTVTLPASPSAGDVVVLKDYARTWATNNITIASNTLDGISSTETFSTNGQTVTLVYMDGTKGWSLINEDTTTDIGARFIAATGGTVTTSGDYKIHTFTGDGCFVVSCGGNVSGSNLVDYLVVAGGGSGGAANAPGAGGGGGAGGFRVSNSYGLPAPTMSPLANPTGLPVSATTYPITVGGGGGGSPISAPGNDGSNSVFSTITSTGGGGGASSPPSNRDASPGGSGGGAAVGSCGSPGIPGCKGSGNTPPVSPPQGNDGGFGAPSPTGPFYWSGGGGGGAGAAGTSAPSTGNAPGGNGSYVSPSFAVGCAGTTGPVCGVRYFAGGGGGGSQAPGQPNDNRATGGAGGGTNGTLCTPNGTGNATANTGGGSGGVGGGGGNNSGGGGKGIVIIRYKFQ